MTFVNPSNYNGSAFLHLFGHVGSLVPSAHLRNGVFVSKQSVCDGKRGISALHGGIKVIFRGPGPFPGAVFRGITCNLHMGNVGSGKCVRRAMIGDLGRIIL